MPATTWYAQDFGQWSNLGIFAKGTIFDVQSIVAASKEVVVAGDASALQGENITLHGTTASDGNYTVDTAVHTTTTLLTLTSGTGLVNQPGAAGNAYLNGTPATGDIVDLQNWDLAVIDELQSAPPSRIIDTSVQQAGTITFCQQPTTLGVKGTAAPGTYVIGTEANPVTLEVNGGTLILLIDGQDLTLYGTVAGSKADGVQVITIGIDNAIKAKLTINAPAGQNAVTNIAAVSDLTAATGAINVSVTNSDPFEVQIIINGDVENSGAGNAAILCYGGAVQINGDCSNSGAGGAILSLDTLGNPVFVKVVGALTASTGQLIAVAPITLALSSVEFCLDGNFVPTAIGAWPILGTALGPYPLLPNSIGPYPVVT